MARDEDEISTLKARRTFLNVTSYGQLTDSLKLTLYGNVQKTRFEGPLGLSPESTYTRASGELFYQPSGQLGVGARLGYVKTDQRSGPTQSYRLQWYPFPGGAFALSTLYDEDVDATGPGERRFRRIQVIPSWTLNRHARFELTYYESKVLEELPGLPSRAFRSRSFRLTLTLTL